MGETTSVYMDTKMIEKIRVMAEKERRSFSQMVVVLVHDAMKSRDLSAITDKEKTSSPSISV